jgi:methionyl-tRNA formyltransferase
VFGTVVSVLAAVASVIRAVASVHAAAVSVNGAVASVISAVTSADVAVESVIVTAAGVERVDYCISLACQKRYLLIKGLSFPDETPLTAGFFRRLARPFQRHPVNRVSGVQRRASFQFLKRRRAV